MTQSDDTARINLYPSVEIALPDRGMRMEISSDFPRLAKGRIRVECQKAETHSLALRIPPWARSMKVKCDGLDVEQPKARRRVLLSRTWPASTTIEAEFVAGLRIVSSPDVWRGGGGYVRTSAEGPHIQHGKIFT